MMRAARARALRVTRLDDVACFVNVLHMSDNVENLMLEILKRLQTDMSGLKSDVSGLKVDVDDMKGRLVRLEDIVTKQRRDIAAILVMMKSTVGVFDERLTAVETDMVMLKERS
jgi:hypothetical protein